MGIFKRGRTYWYEFVHQGQRFRRSTHTRNQVAARQIEAGERAALAKGEHGIVTPSRIPTFRQFAETFLAGVETDAERPKTIKMYRTAVAGLLACPPLAKARLDRIDADTVAEFKQWKTKQVSRFGKRFSPRTINLQLRVLRVILGKAHERDHIRKVPKVGKVGGEQERDFILRDETAYLDHADPNYRDMALTMLDAGLRIGEALSLEWPQVQIKGKAGYLVITKAKAKGKRERRIPLTERLRETLKARGPQKSGYVFNDEGRPRPYTTVRREHDQARVAAKLSDAFTIHSLRHTFGTRLGESGADGFVIMRLMGHANIRDTERYVHLSDDAMERAIGKLDGVPTTSPQEPKKTQKTKGF